jgi:hypothetical protein
MEFFNFNNIKHNTSANWTECSVDEFEYMWLNATNDNKIETNEGCRYVNNDGYEVYRLSKHWGCDSSFECNWFVGGGTATQATAGKAFYGMFETNSEHPSFYEELDQKSQNKINDWFMSENLDNFEAVKQLFKQKQNLNIEQKEIKEIVVSTIDEYNGSDETSEIYNYHNNFVYKISAGFDFCYVSKIHIKTFKSEIWHNCELTDVSFEEDKTLSETW